MKKYNKYIKPMFEALSPLKPFLSEKFHEEIASKTTGPILENLK
jgi:hypothetical protein